MTVRELIEKLAAFPPHLPVHVSGTRLRLDRKTQLRAVVISA